MTKRLALAFLGFLAAVALPGCIGLEFSPDGKQIVAITAKGLAVMNVDGSGLQVLPEGVSGWMPSWSPDGKNILFVKHEEQEGDLLLYNTATHKVRNIGSNY